MKDKTGNINPLLSPALKFGGLILIFLFLSCAALAQNTKGDRPASSREGRFKIGQKKKTGGRAANSKRVKTKGRSYANSGGESRGRYRSSERAGKPIKPVFGVKKPSDRQRPWKGDIAGRPLRHKNQSSSQPNIHPQTGRAVRRTVPDREGRQNVTGGRPVRIPSATGKVRNVYPQKGKFVHNPSSKPRDTQRAVSNKQALARLKTLETRKPPPGKKVRVVPRTASRPFIRNKSINVYANFKRPKRKSEQAVTTDIAGKRLRKKNFQSTPPGFVKAPRTYKGKRRIGERGYRGPGGSYVSISGKNQRAWIGDITNRRVGNRSSKKSIEGTPTLFRGNRSATRTGRVGVGGGYRSATRTGQVGVGRGYRSATRTGQVGVGGGYKTATRSGRVGTPIPSKAPGIGAKGIGNYRGNRRQIRGFVGQGEEFTGHIKAGRRQKGKIPAYPGKHKLFEIEKGFQDQGEEYSGAIKARRPVKGGGSVSGKLWNNNETPIQGKTPSDAARDQAAFTGNTKLSRREYVQNKKAHELSILKRRPAKSVYEVEGMPVRVQRRSFVKNKNASEDALMKLKPSRTDAQVSELQVRVKQAKYVRNPSSADDALKVKEPGKAFARVTDYQGNIKMKRFRFTDRNRELHPDARFVKTNRNNVKEERDSITNLKLWWARLFKKQENQPDHLKEKGKKPRYDKGEQGMWYD